MPEIYIGLGSNVNRRQHIRCGLDMLAAEFGELTVSSVYKSDAVGFSGAPFYNLVVAVVADISLTALTVTLKAIEDANGRDRTAVKYSDRTLDLDVLTYGEWAGDLEGIMLPREETTQMAYILGPMAQIAGPKYLPGSRSTYQELWDAFDQASQPITKISRFWFGGNPAADIG